MRLKTIISCLVISFTASGCAIGMLLFYRDVRTETIFKSPGSRKDYYEIKAQTLSHCGCTDLYINNYAGRQKDFTIFYSNRGVSKTIYAGNDTIRLIATDQNYSVAFNDLDKVIFGTIDSLLAHKPKGLAYPPERRIYKGYVPDMR